MENVGAYVHIPFCRTKCNYCSFNSVPLDRELMPAYLEALVSEIQAFPHKDRFLVESIYLGGGTPTVLREEDIRIVLSAFGKKYQLSAALEITIESNPGSITAQKAQHLAERGVNRVSIGVQSFRDEELALLGRKHTAREAEDAYMMTREGGIDNINLDLIYAIPGQSVGSFLVSLEKTLELRPDHVSLYALALEEGTPLCTTVEKGELVPVTQDVDREMYDVAVTLLTGAGYEHYEISNFALPERRCRHNMFYWNNLPYLGFGAGAVTYLDGWRRSNVRQPAEYVRRVRGGENLMQEAEKLSAHRELAETLILGLRLVKGIDLGALERRFPGIALDALKGSLAPLAEQGLLERRNGNIRLSADGLRLANKVFSEILDLPLSTVL